MDEKIKDGVSFIMGPGGDEGTVAPPAEPDGYAVLLDDPKGATPGACGYWYVGAYRTEVVAKGVAERNKGARVVPMYFSRSAATRFSLCVECNELVTPASSLCAREDCPHSSVAQSAAVASRDEREFLATMAQESGPEAAEAVADFLRATRSATGTLKTHYHKGVSAENCPLCRDAERLSWLNLHWERIEYGGGDLAKLRESIDAAMRATDRSADAA